jgi:lysophospholipase L1-like esterase
LAKVDKHADFLVSYVNNCKKLVKANSGQIFFLTPTPPSDLYENHPSYPRFGELSERMDAYLEFSRSLSIAAEQQSCKLIDLSDELLSSSGGLRAELTDDGCHLNQKGATLVRKLILADE